MQTVLVVEDSALIRQIYYLCLDGTVFKIVAEAKTGFEALTLLRSHKPDIVILDLVLPEMSGLDVLKRMPDLSSNSKTLVITSLDDSELLKQVAALGAIHILQKPFSKEALLSHLSSLSPQMEERKHG